MKTKTHLCESIRKARKLLGYSQQHMAGLLGMSRTGLSRYENGNRKAPMRVLNQLKQMLGGSTAHTLTQVLRQRGA